ncbi:MAG TPA: Clp protease N-terminal domain-containing protein [Gemmatimonadaceae bacterium]
MTDDMHPASLATMLIKGVYMSWRSSFTDRADDTLECTRLALKRNPGALATAELMSAIESRGPSLARGMLTALEVAITEVLDRARVIATERGSEIAWRRLQSQPATLDMIIRRATEEAAMLGHRRVGTEHLLLAVISAHDDPTTCALRAAGVTQDTARGTLRRLLVSWNDDGCPKPRVSVA